MLADRAIVDRCAPCPEGIAQSGFTTAFAHRVTREFAKQSIAGIRTLDSLMDQTQTTSNNVSMTASRWILVTSSALVDPGRNNKR